MGRREMRAYRRAVAAFATTFLLLGFAVLIRTAVDGGGIVGFVIGALFVALGAARLHLLRRGPS
jgi:hypothetical protein